jgi:hypothetical protein
MNCTHNKKLKSLLAVAMLAGLSMSAAEAAAVYMEPDSQAGIYDPEVPSTVSFELWMDFTNEPTIGGGIDLDLQGPISMAEFTPSSYFTDTADPSFTGHGTENADNDYQIHFGNFAGLSGVNKLGDITVNLLGSGLGSISLAINTFYGGFFGTDFLSIDVDVSDEAAITASAVPAPAGVWLLLTGLAGLVTRRFARRR